MNYSFQVWVIWYGEEFLNIYCIVAAGMVSRIYICVFLHGKTFCVHSETIVECFHRPGSLTALFWEDAKIFSINIGFSVRVIIVLGPSSEMPAIKVKLWEVPFWCTGFSTWKSSNNCTQIHIKYRFRIQPHRWSELRNEVLRNSKRCCRARSQWKLCYYVIFLHTGDPLLMRPMSVVIYL